MARHLTKAQREALDWLRERGGDGMFNIHGVLLAAGELAPHVRSTWNALEASGLVEHYRPNGAKGRGRLRLTALGRQPLPSGADYIIGRAGRADIYDTATGEILAEGATQARQGAPAR